MQSKGGPSNYQALAAQASAFNGQFVQPLTAGAFSYASIEAAITSYLQNLNMNAGFSFDAGTLVSFVATTPPQQLLEDIGTDILLVLTAPIWIPVLILLLDFLY